MLEQCKREGQSREYSTGMSSGKHVHGMVFEINKARWLSVNLAVSVTAKYKIHTIRDETACCPHSALDLPVAANPASIKPCVAQRVA